MMQEANTASEATIPEQVTTPGWEHTFHGSGYIRSPNLNQSRRTSLYCLRQLSDRRMIKVDADRWLSMGYVTARKP